MHALKIKHRLYLSEFLRLLSQVLPFLLCSYITCLHVIFLSFVFHLLPFSDLLLPLILLLPEKMKT